MVKNNEELKHSSDGGSIKKISDKNVATNSALTPSSDKSYLLESIGSKVKSAEEDIID